MITKHFFKILVLFALMIVFGIIAVLISSNLKQGTPVPDVNNKTQIAK